MSLLGSIFGTSQDEAPESSLSGVFEKPFSAGPQHVAPPRRKRESIQQEEHYSSNKLKKKQRKSEGSNELGDSKRPAQSVESPDETSLVEKETTSEASEEPIEIGNNDAEERTIFVGNLPLETTRKSLASLFKDCGKIESTRLRSVAAAGVKLPPAAAGNQNLMLKVCANTDRVDAKVKTTAQGYVVFASKECVETALEKNNKMVNGVTLRVDHAKPTMDATRTVFLGNLPYQAQEYSLQTHVARACQADIGDIVNVRIVRDPATKQCKGFAYVLFANKALVATALRVLPNTIYMKRPPRAMVCGKRFKGNAKSKKRKTEGALQRMQTQSNKRRARGPTKKAPPTKAVGKSKRAAAKAKAGKRTKKIEKRITKGMGKARK